MPPREPDIFIVKVQDIDSVWPRVKHLIEASLKYSPDLSLLGLLMPLRRGDYFLWVTEDLKSAAITSFDHWPEYQVMRVLALGSEVHRDWIRGFEDFKKFAASHGAKYVIPDGRKGWSRVLGTKPVSYNYMVSTDG